MLALLNSPVFTDCIDVCQETSAFHQQLLKSARSANRPCCLQQLASHTTSYFPEVATKIKLTGSKLTHKKSHSVSVPAHCLQHGHSRLLLPLKFQRSPSGYPTVSSCISKLMHKAQALPWFWVVPARAQGARHAASMVLKASACCQSATHMYVLPALWDLSGLVEQ